jgi:hypothetical protein
LQLNWKINFCSDGTAAADPVPGLPDFSWYNIPKREKYAKMTTKYTNWPLNIPNGSKIDGVSINFTSIFYCKTLQNLPKLSILV